MGAIVKYVLLNGIRDRLFLSLLFSLIISFAISVIFGSTFIIEKNETVSAFNAGSSRLIFLIGFILFVCISLNRSFDNKEIEFILSKSISRPKIIIAYINGYILAAMLILLPLILSFIIFIKADLLGIFFWSLSLILETLIVIIFAILATLILGNVLTSIIASFAFYFLSRMMGVFVMAIKTPENFEQFFSSFFASSLKIISVLFPRLDLFTKSSWIIYGIDNFYEIKIIVIQSVIYISLLIMMSFYDFKRKQF